METYGAPSDIDAQKPWACSTCGTVRQLDANGQCAPCGRLR